MKMPREEFANRLTISLLGSCVLIGVSLGCIATGIPEACVLSGIAFVALNIWAWTEP